MKRDAAAATRERRQLPAVPVYTPADYPLIPLGRPSGSVTAWYSSAGFIFFQACTHSGGSLPISASKLAAPLSSAGRRGADCSVPGFRRAATGADSWASQPRGRQRARYRLLANSRRTSAEPLCKPRGGSSLPKSVGCDHEPSFLAPAPATRGFALDRAWHCADRDQRLGRFGG